MNKTLITARVIDQTLHLVNCPRIASGGVDEVKIYFDFCSLWDGCGKTAVFYRDPEAVYHVPIVEGVATVPHEVLTDAGHFYIGVMGAADNIRTTEVLRVRVVQGAITEATANHEEPTPNIYQQLMRAYAVMGSRVDALIAMRGVGGNATHTISGAHINGTIISNGSSAYINLQIAGLVISAGGIYSSSYLIPPEYAPLCPVNGVSLDPELSVTILPADAENDGWARLTIRNTSGTDYGAGVATTCVADYPLALPYNAELGDARVAVDGHVYPTAGEAIRAQAKQVTPSEIGAIDKLTPAFTESGTMVTCRPVEGYPLTVVTAGGANLISGTSYLDESQWDFQAGFGEDAEECYVLKLGNSFESGTYSFSGYAEHGIHLAYFNEYPACWDDVVSVRGEFNENCDITFEEDFTENRIALIIVEAELGDRTLAEVIASLRDLKLQKGVAPTKIMRTGKNLLPYPYVTANHTSRGVDFTDNGDGSITINGTPTAAYSAIYNLCTDNLILKDGVTYTMPAIQENIWFSIVYNDAGGAEHTARTVTWSKDYVLKRFIIIISTMNEISNVTVFPQLEIGKTPTAYEPYRGGEFAPGEAVPALTGVNTLWADAGEITVTGRADPVAIIADLYEKINNLQKAAVNNA